ncbi:MAG: PPC domain-containing protein [Leptolyngbya sp. SIO1E4]|nr:PPC domain-containing protein [Leptolyngbya sp. SIO1E4]
MLIPLLIAQAVSTADYPCWMETANGQIVNMDYLCQPATAMPDSDSSSAEQASTQGGGYVLQQQGRLEAGDEIASDGSLFDRYTFEGQAGQFVTITLDSEEFDTYLELLDGSENLLAADDDRDFTTTNSAISIALPETGTYQVIVNSFWMGEQGSYTLVVQGATTP